VSERPIFDALIKAYMRDHPPGYSFGIRGHFYRIVASPLGHVSYEEIPVADYRRAPLRYAVYTDKAGRAAFHLYPGGRTHHMAKIAILHFKEEYPDYKFVRFSHLSTLLGSAYAKWAVHDHLATGLHGYKNEIGKLLPWMVKNTDTQ